MNIATINRKLFTFLKESPSPYHAIRTIERILIQSGFIALTEMESWNLKKGQPYYVKREDGALVAFNLGKEAAVQDGFRIIGSHSDSPCLQIKPKPDIFEKTYHKVGVEVYGGALLTSWFDRELSIAGRVCCQTKQKALKTKLINFDRPVAIIPSLAIHFDRKANTEKTIDAQKDITPLIGLYSDSTNDIQFRRHLLDQINKEHSNDIITTILGYDLFFYDHRGPGFAGMNGEFIVSSRLDNLLSCFIATEAMASADRNNNFMFICNNHEEVGSNSTTGAQGNMALSVFERLISSIDTRQSVIANSFMISIDNAHAVHPNFPEKSEPSHDIFLNHGPVLKINANQRYATSGQSNAIFKVLCQEVNVPVQEFVMRNDMACGSTIGPVTAAKIGVKTVDVGSASLAMHSIREMTGNKDPFLMHKVVQSFLQRKEILSVSD